MRALVELIAAALVDDPRAVRVREQPGSHETTLELRVAPADMGRIIGRGGRTVRSIRSLLSIAGRKAHRRWVLEIAE